MGKALLYIIEGFSRLGWSVKTITPNELGIDPCTGFLCQEKLRRYLKNSNENFDVIEFDSNILPFSRNEFPKNTLMVARSQLLTHHLMNLHLPREETWRAFLRDLFFKRRSDTRLRNLIEYENKSFEMADLVVVLNDLDLKVLTEQGIPAGKIEVMPNGIDSNELDCMAAAKKGFMDRDKICFLGSFYPRKGSSEIPKIFFRIENSIKNIKFGVFGSSRDSVKVQKMFPKNLLGKLNIIEKFSAAELPGLLSNCSLGVFPSYVEGFPLSVLEMYASFMPVIAYNSPGLSGIISREDLVDAGDWQGLCDKAIKLIKNPSQLAKKSLEVREISLKYKWEIVCKRTSDIYLTRMGKMKN